MIQHAAISPCVIHVTMNDAPFEITDGKGRHNNEEIRSCMPGWRRAVLHGSQLRPPMTRHCHRLRLAINLINTHPFVPACKRPISALYFAPFGFHFDENARSDLRTRVRVFSLPALYATFT